MTVRVAATGGSDVDPRSLNVLGMRASGGEAMCLKNCWYVVTWSDELENQILGRTVCDEKREGLVSERLSFTE